jgi:glycerol uptake facilitator protein
MVGTTVLVMSVFALIDPENQVPNGIRPFLIGLVVFSIGLSLGGTTGYAINPARDLGPRIAHSLVSYPKKGSSEWEYSWIPVIAPLTGAVLGYFVYSYWIQGIEAIF